MVNADKDEYGLTSSEGAEVDDETEHDHDVVPLRYDITSFGVDYDVEGLVRRLQKAEIFIPDFQRSFVWNISDASKFIESLLLGLPVPGVFLARESDSGKLLVIDGQQRLKTLMFFYGGEFNPGPEDKTRRIFRLTDVQQQFDGLSYESLAQKDRIDLDNSVIHATIVKQDAPPDDDTSLYQLFSRLNSIGRHLNPQELRCALYHGEFIDAVKTLNDHEGWRSIFGRKNRRLKDQELILRFMALFFDSKRYKRPMSEFLNTFVQRNRQPGDDFLAVAAKAFARTIDEFHSTLGKRAFRLKTGRALNAAVFDSMAVGLARRINSSGAPSSRSISRVYEGLLRDDDYLEAVSRSTADEAFVGRRLSKATEQFADA